MWLANTGMVERVTERVVEVDPAAVLIAGDFLYSSSPDPAEQVQQVLDLLAPIVDARIPTFAVLGNHDYELGGSAELTAALEAAGITVLLNASAVIPTPPGVRGEPLRIVGLGPSRPPVADPSKALDDVPDPAPRVTNAAQPDRVPAAAASLCALRRRRTHHCGQVTLPGTPDWSYLGLNEAEEVVADGFAPVAYGAEGHGMHVTCGIGFSLVPMRINAPPQLLLVDLTAGG